MRDTSLLPFFGTTCAPAEDRTTRKIVILMAQDPQFHRALTGYRITAMRIL